MTGLRIFVVSLMLLSTVASSLPARTDSGGGDSMIADWFGRETAASLADADPAPAVHLQGVFTTFSIIVFAQFMNASLSVLANSLEQKRVCMCTLNRHRNVWGACLVTRCDPTAPLKSQF